MKNKIFKIGLTVLMALIIIGSACVFGINAYVKKIGKDHLLTSKEAAKLTDVDCIVVLGCKVKEDGVPSPMLRDRLIRGIELYKMGVSPKLLMSGDHGRNEYNEVGTMKQYAIDHEIPSSDIFMDHAGFSTYESIYRAKKIFGADKIIIVTQEYHLYRSLYIAEKLGIEAYGVASDYSKYGGQSKRKMREILARVKDFGTTIFKPEPKYLGEAIPVNGNGDMTND